MREIRTHGSMSGKWKRSMVRLVRHPQTKERATDRLHLNHRATSRLYPILARAEIVRNAHLCRHSLGVPRTRLPSKPDTPKLFLLRKHPGKPRFFRNRIKAAIHPRRVAFMQRIKKRCNFQRLAAWGNNPRRAVARRLAHEVFAASIRSKSNTSPGC